MENFSVTLSGLKRGIDEEQNIINSLAGLESDIRAVQNGLGFQIKGQADITNVLQRLATDIGNQTADMRNMKSALANVSSEYAKTESNICGFADGNSISEKDIWEAITKIGEGLAFSALYPPMGAMGFLYDILGNEKNDAKSKWGNFSHKLWDDLDDKKKDNLGKEHYEWENGHWVKKEASDHSDSSKKEKTAAQRRKEILENITIWEGSLSTKRSLLHFGDDAETDWGNYSYSADFLQAEAKASASVTAGGIEAKVGVAFSAFTAEAAAQLGNDMLGAHGNVEVDIGHAEAEVGVSIGIWDDEGNLDLRAKADASAEVIVAEVSGTVGVDIAGTDIDLKGSLNFGVGAHASVGFEDGKFSLDVGASLGVGGSVSLEIDVSGTLDMIADFTNDIGQAAMDAYNAAADFVSDAANAVGDFVGDVADSIGNVLSSVSKWFRW